MKRQDLNSLLWCCPFLVWAVTTLAAAPAAPAYVPEDHRPPLFIRETFPLPPGQAAQNLILSQSAVSAPGFELKIYGQTQSPPGPHDSKSPTHGGLELVRRDSPKDDPSFVYFGSCLTPCAMTLRSKDNYVDLTGLAKIKWRTWQTGYHALRPIAKLANGTWLVGDYAEAAASDWNEREFALLDVHWHLFNADKVVTAVNADWVEKPDLSRVDEVGFADLMPGNLAENGHGRASTSRLDWIEVWGNPVKR